MFSTASVSSAFVHDEKVFRAKIPYPLVATNLQGAYACSAPSSELDPNKASACDLVKNGLLWRRPSATDVPALQQAWRKVFSRKWRAENRIPPVLHPQLRRTHALKEPLKRVAAASLVNRAWAGAGTRGGSWTGVIGFWKIPTVAKPSEPESFAGGWTSSSWIGIDGFDLGITSNDMLLAGVEQHVSPSGVTSHVAWFEWYAPAQAGSPPYIYQTNIANFPVSPGQEIYCSVQYIGNIAGYIYFANEATGQHFSITLAPPAGATFSGNTAEWIVEVPDKGEHFTTLPRFTPVAFTSAIACGSSGALGNPQMGDTANIEDASGEVLTSVAVGNCSATIDFVGQEQRNAGRLPRSSGSRLGSERREQPEGSDKVATFCTGRDPRR
jgi:Peptidase A4 family